MLHLSLFACISTASESGSILAQVDTALKKNLPHRKRLILGDQSWLPLWESIPFNLS